MNTILLYNRILPTVLMLVLLAVTVLAWTANATEGRHIEEADLDGLVDDIKALVATPQVVEREVQVVREVEVIREVEVSPEVSESLGFGLSGDTANGCGIPDMYLAYNRIADGLTATGRVNHGGNRACEPATSADISIERDFGRISIELGYDQRGVSFAGDACGVPLVDGKCSKPILDQVGLPEAVTFYGSLSASTAVVNYEFDVGRVNIETGYNIPGQAPRVAASWSNEAETLSAEADMTAYEAGRFTTLKGSWNRGFGDAWGMEAYVSVSFGIDNVPDPVGNWDSKRSGEVVYPVNPPTMTHSYGVGVTRSL